MRIHTFWGDFTDIAAKKEALLITVVGGRRFWPFFVFSRRLNIYYIHTLYITYILYAHIQLYPYLAGRLQ